MRYNSISCFGYLSFPGLLPMEVAEQYLAVLNRTYHCVQYRTSSVYQKLTNHKHKGHANRYTGPKQNLSQFIDWTYYPFCNRYKNTCNFSPIQSNILCDSVNHIEFTATSLLTPNYGTTSSISWDDSFQRRLVAFKMTNNSLQKKSWNLFY